MISRPIKIPELVSDRLSFQNQHRTGARKGSPMPGQVVNLTLFVFFCLWMFILYFYFFVFLGLFLYVMRAAKHKPLEEKSNGRCEAANQFLFVFVCLYFVFAFLYFSTFVLRTGRGLAPEREVQWPVKLSICRYLFHRRLNIATTAPKLTSPQIKLD